MIRNQKTFNLVNVWSISLNYFIEQMLICYNYISTLIAAVTLYKVLDIKAIDDKHLRDTIRLN